MNKVILSLVVANILLTSCGNSTNEKSNKQTETVIHNEHHHDEESEAIELNNGEKWKVDTNMIIHIRNMEYDVLSYAKVEQKDYKFMSKKLQSNIDLLTSNCTMKGKAHDELHKWLLPFIDLVTELSEVKDEYEAEIKIKNIQTSFTVFNQYFQ